MKKNIAVLVAFSMFTSNFTAFAVGRDTTAFANRIEVYEKVGEIYSGRGFFIKELIKVILLRTNREAKKQD